MAVRFQLPSTSFLDSNGDPLSGARLEFYEGGTTTPLDTFSDRDLTVPNANPVVADAAGRFGDIWLQSQDYKVVLKNSSGVVVVTMDPVEGNPTVSGDDFKVTPQSSPDMTVQVAGGTLFDSASKTRIVQAVQNTGTFVAPSGNPRRDIVHVGRRSGTVGVTTGAEAASPVDPVIPDNTLPLARVSLTPTTTALTDAEITDIRELNMLGLPGEIATYRFTDTSDVTISTTVPTGTLWSSSQTIVIPAAGIIMMYAALRIDNAAGGSRSYYIGLRIGGTDYFVNSDSNGTPVYLAFANNIATGQFVTRRTSAAAIDLIVGAFSIPSGAQTVQPVIASDNGTGTQTLKGATVTSRLNIMVVKH